MDVLVSCFDALQRDNSRLIAYLPTYLFTQLHINDSPSDAHGSIDLFYCSRLHSLLVVVVVCTGQSHLLALS